MFKILTVCLTIGILSSNIYVFTKISEARALYESFHEARNLMILAQQTLSNLKDAETGYRGYVITGKAEFLQPYNHAIDKIDFQLENLKKFERFDQSKVDKLSCLTHKMLISLKENISQVDKGDVSHVAIFEKTSRNKNLMDSIRVVVDEIESSARDKNASERQKFVDVIVWSEYTAIIDSILAFALVLLFFWMIGK